MEPTMAVDVHSGVERGAAFADRLLGVVNSASLALGLSIGHRTGLLDAMAAFDGGPIGLDVLRGEVRRG